MAIVLTLVTAACMSKGSNTPQSGQSGSGSNGSASLPPPPQTAAHQGPTCESAIANSMTLTIAAASDAERDQVRTQLDGAKPKMIAACHEDKWSADLLDCLDKARTDAATGTCTDLLTPAQQQGVQKRLTGS